MRKVVIYLCFFCYRLNLLEVCDTSSREVAIEVYPKTPIARSRPVHMRTSADNSLPEAKAWKHSSVRMSDYSPFTTPVRKPSKMITLIDEDEKENLNHDEQIIVDLEREQDMYKKNFYGSYRKYITGLDKNVTTIAVEGLIRLKVFEGIDTYRKIIEDLNRHYNGILRIEHFFKQGSMIHDYHIALFFLFFEKKGLIDNSFAVIDPFTLNCTHVFRKKVVGKDVIGFVLYYHLHFIAAKLDLKSGILEIYDPNYWIVKNSTSYRESAPKKILSFMESAGINIKRSLEIKVFKGTQQDSNDCGICSSFWIISSLVRNFHPFEKESSSADILYNSRDLRTLFGAIVEYSKSKLVETLESSDFDSKYTK